jgi:hypothetical protein
MICHATAALTTQPAGGIVSPSACTTKSSVWFLVRRTTRLRASVSTRANRVERSPPPTRASRASRMVPGARGITFGICSWPLSPDSLVGSCRSHQWHRPHRRQWHQVVSWAGLPLICAKSVWLAVCLLHAPYQDVYVGTPLGVYLLPALALQFAPKLRIPSNGGSTIKLRTNNRCGKAYVPWHSVLDIPRRTFKLISHSPINQWCTYCCY